MPRPLLLPEMLKFRAEAGTKAALMEMARPGEKWADVLRRIILEKREKADG